jgi:hypothetical protein
MRSKVVARGFAGIAYARKTERGRDRRERPRGKDTEEDEKEWNRT